MPAVLLSLPRRAVRGGGGDLVAVAFDTQAAGVCVFRTADASEPSSRSQRQCRKHNWDLCSVLKAQKGWLVSDGAPAGLMNRQRSPGFQLFSVVLLVPAFFTIFLESASGHRASFSRAAFWHRCSQPLGAGVPPSTTVLESSAIRYLCPGDC